MPDYGSGGIYEVKMDGPFSGGGGEGTVEIISNIVVLKDSWKGATSPYSQPVEIPNANVNSKVDIQFCVEQLESLSQQSFSLVIGNLGGEFTLYAVGDKPLSDIELQISITDVLNVGSAIRGIFGNTISTNKPRPDYQQNDPSRADYIQNRPTEEIKEIKEKADGALQKKGGTMKGQIDMGNNPISNVPDPKSDDHAPNKKYVDSVFENAKKYSDDKHIPLTAIIGTAWEGITAPYSQWVAIEGILKEDWPHVMPKYTEDLAIAVSEKEAWQMIDYGMADNGGIYFLCFEDKPVTAIPIQIEVNR